MNTKQFLNWIADRIVHVYSESENVDFVARLRAVASVQRSGDSTAITALTRMVKAFGSGVQAADTAQCGALAEAYACIENELLAQRPVPIMPEDTKASVEPVPAQPGMATPIIWDTAPAEANRSVGDVAQDWPGGGGKLADYVERNKGNRVRISFVGNGVPDKVCTIERIGSITYFWVLDDQGAVGGRFSVAFCDVHTITRIPNQCTTPHNWPMFPGRTVQQFMSNRLGQDVRITLKNSNVHAGTVEKGGSIDYFWLKNSRGIQSVYFDDVQYVDTLTARREPHSWTTLWPYTREEPAAPDSWPGGVSLNSYLNKRVGQMIAVDYGESGTCVTGKVFRDPSRAGQYRLLLRTGTEAIVLALVWGVTCAK